MAQSYKGVVAASASSSLFKFPFSGKYKLGYLHIIRSMTDIIHPKMHHLCKFGQSKAQSH